MNQQIKNRDIEYIMNTYARFDAYFVSGKGSVLYDDEGNEYIDYSSGIGVNILGHGNKDIAEAVYNQSLKLCHTSNLFYTENQIKLAERLCKISGFSRVFFANSGAEANEGAIKLARKYSFDKYGEGRSNIITLKNSFHGRTITTLSATGQESFHKFFGPFTEGFIYVEANNIEDLIQKANDSVCAIMLEAIQGEGGVNLISSEFAQAVFEIAEKKDILVIFDEVQTGMARTGKMFGFENLISKKPDIITLAKGLGGGLPIGAFVCSEKIKNVLGHGDHGSTFGGNPVACAASLAVLDNITKEGFLDSVNEKGLYIKDKINALNIPSVKEVRGLGLMLGIALKEGDAREVAAKCLQKGLVILTAKGNVIRLLPPLNITYDEIDRGLKILVDVLEEIA